jgi:hypothetical protein
MVPRFSLLAGIARFAGMVIRARMDGSFRRTPFFDTGTGTAVIAPRVLNSHEREALRNAVSPR